VAAADKELKQYIAEEEETHRAIWRRDTAKYLVAATEISPSTCGTT